MAKFILSAVRETFGKVTYTHKTYEKASDICNYRSAWVKRMNIILLALTSGSAIGSILKGEDFIIFTSILATISLFFSVYQYNFNFDKQAHEYKITAKKLWLVREKYQNLIADIMADEVDQDESAKKRDLLLEEYDRILENAPNTFPKAYEQARKALKLEEEMTFNTEEIDFFLPEELRLK